MEKPIKTIRVSAGTRIYYFDEHKDTKGQSYLSITEEPVGRSPRKKKRQRIFIHKENLEKFADAFNEMAKHTK